MFVVRRSFAWALHEVSEEAKLLRKNHLTEVALIWVPVSMTTFVQYKGAVLWEYDITADTAIEFALQH